MKKLLTVLLFSMMFSAVGFTDEAPIANNSTEDAVAQSDQLEEIAQMNSNDTMSSGCAALPADQQSFSMQLNSSNKNMFCNSFNTDQRKSAMQMTSSSNMNGTKMSADQAVEQVARNNNIMPSTPSPRSSSGCPVR